MKRKVVRQGSGTLTISLPQEWTKNYDILNGDELDISIDNNILIVRADSEKHSDKRVFDVNELKKLLNIWIIRSYQEGADELKIICNDLTSNDLIRVVSESIGYEIVKQEKDYVIIKDISGNTKEDFDILFRRVLYLLQTILEETYEALKDNDVDQIKQIIDKDLEINKLSSRCIRTLSKNNFPNDRQKYYIMNQMEELGDLIKDILKKFLKYDLEANKQILETLFQINLFFKMCHEFYFNPKRTKALEIANMYETLRKKPETLTEELNSKQLLLIPPLYSLINKIITLQRIKLTQL